MAEGSWVVAWAGNYYVACLKSTAEKHSYRVVERELSLENALEKVTSLNRNNPDIPGTETIPASQAGSDLRQIMASYLKQRPEQLSRSCPLF